SPSDSSSLNFAGKINRDFSSKRGVYVPKNMWHNLQRCLISISQALRSPSSYRPTLPHFAPHARFTLPLSSISSNLATTQTELRLPNFVVFTSYRLDFLQDGELRVSQWRKKVWSCEQCDKTSKTLPH